MLKFSKIFFLLSLVSLVTFGQKEVNSPYARFGPGILESSSAFKSASMGGTGIAIRDSKNLFYQNPASYSNIDTNSFVFDFALDYRIIKLDDGNSSYTSDDMNLHHIVMGFPIGKKAGFVTGITPFSSGYYNLNSTISQGDPEYDPIIGETTEYHYGEGGISKFFFGTGVEITKGLSLGANMSFLFGVINRENRLNFMTDNNYFDNVYTENLALRGLYFDLGAQYHIEIGEKYFSTLGFKYSNSSKFKVETSSLLKRESSYTGSIYSTDTLDYNPTSETNVTLPSSLSLGISFGIKDKLLISADYTNSDWTTAKFLGYENMFTSSSGFNFGAEFIPNKYANRNVLNRVEYRLGGRILNSHLMVNNEQLKEFGITFGVGMPLNKSKSSINIFMEYGSRRGSFDNGLHKEDFYNMGISFNFYDRWFLKKKYN